MDFNIELAQQLLDTDEQFPVDFDLAWQWLGYTRKDSAKEKLVRNFEKGLDYSAEWRSVAHTKVSSASKTEKICLTIDAFKSFGMMAGTEKGKQVRRYFLECERIVKTIAPTQPELPQTYLEALKALVESEEEKERLKAQNELQAAEIDELEEDNERLSELTDELFNYSSIIRIALFNGVSEKSFKWRTLKAATKIAKLEVRRVPCPRFGEKLLYPHEAWTIAYPDAKLPKNPQSSLAVIKN